LRVQPPGSIAAVNGRFWRVSPVPWVLANVHSPNPQQPFAAASGTGGPRAVLIDLLPGKPPAASWTEARMTKVAKVSAWF